MPTLTAGTTLWARVEVNAAGTAVTLKCLSGASAPTEAQWAATLNAYSNASFDHQGGMIGFAASTQYNLPNSRPILGVDDLRVERWNPATSAYDVLEASEDFSSASEANFAGAGPAAGVTPSVNVRGCGVPCPGGHGLWGGDDISQ